MFNVNKTLSRLAAIAVMGSLSLAAAAADSGRSYRFDIKSQSLAQALRSFGRVAGQELIFSDDVVKGGRAVSLEGEFTADVALSRLLEGSGFVAKRAASGAIRIVKEGNGSAADEGPADQMRLSMTGEDD